MDCPVCNKADISLDIKTCPQCGSDLETVSLITRLDESIKKIRKKLIIISIITAAIIIACLIRLYTLYQFRGDANSQLEKNKSEIILLKSNVDSLKKLVPQNSQTQKRDVTEKSVNYKVHLVKSGDSLWKLAQQYLGDGNKYLKIASDNNLEKPYLLKEGQEIKIYSQ